SKITATRAASSAMRKQLVIAIPPVFIKVIMARLGSASRLQAARKLKTPMKTDAMQNLEQAPNEVYSATKVAVGGGNHSVQEKREDDPPYQTMATIQRNVTPVSRAQLSTIKEECAPESFDRQLRCPRRHHEPCDNPPRPRPASSWQTAAELFV